MEPTSIDSQFGDAIENDPFYIRTPSPPADDRRLVLKEGDSFAVLDAHGDIRHSPSGEEGLFHEGMRHLSWMRLRLGRRRPLLLSSGVRQDNTAIAADFTNPDLMRGETIDVPRGTLHLSRLIVLSHGVLYDRVRVRSYSPTPVAIEIEIDFDADFTDLFEVRGTPRERRGERLDSTPGESEVTLAYRGLDAVTRRTRLAVTGAAARVSERRAVIPLDLGPHGERSFVFTVGCDHGVPESPRPFGDALLRVSQDFERRRNGFAQITTSNQQFNEWIRRSVADLSMMISSTRHGEYPFAGVPWFSCPFGRDGLISALACLWVDPDMARGVLSFLAATQATADDAETDAQPGKILHETRTGEMAALGEIPFARYYGSHDATPLFVMLAAAYLERTDDRAFIERIWPAITAALEWIDRDGDPDADGFLEYARQSPAGLVHQGWKDSHDAVSHSDGALAEGPIALCELQAYLYGAWRGAAVLSVAMSQTERAADYARRAAALHERFDPLFWHGSLGTYVMALDGQKRPCAVRSSNAGHVLFTGLASHRRSGAVARSLMGPELFSGWGIRTLAATEARYNPMSYHNGSVWPHDNAIIAAGLARYGFHDEAVRLLGALFEASLHMDLHRLPELFCGFARGQGEGPVRYPVACTPHAWASASVFQLLQAVLGLEIHAAARTVKFTRPRLPQFLAEVEIRSLKVGPHSIDLLLERHEHNVGVNVLRRTGFAEVVVIK
jgi:glycogen debranching enzyme